MTNRFFSFAYFSYHLTISDRKSCIKNCLQAQACTVSFSLSLYPSPSFSHTQKKENVHIFQKRT